MNAAHWHLVLNHLPIMASLFGVLILFYGWYLDNTEVIRVACALFVIAGVAVIPVYETGESAEEIAENLEGVTENSIEAHEESAETSYYLLLFLGLSGAGVLVRTFQVESVSSITLAFLLFVALIALGSVADTATEGGKIRHPEIQVTPGTAENS